MAKTERIESRLTPADRKTLEHAATIAGQPLSTFIIQAALEEADRVIAAQNVTLVSADFFEELIRDIDSPDPAPGLARTIRKAREASRIRLT